MARKKVVNETKNAIIRVAIEMFLERGFTNTSARAIAAELGISTGNITFYFPSKEHLLMVLVEMLCDSQWSMLEQQADEEETALMAFCMETMTVAVACEQNEIARDLFLSVFQSELCRNLLRENHVARAERIFSEYCGDWTHQQFRIAEILVMGIQHAVIIPTDVEIPLSERIAAALNQILSIYGVPENNRAEKIRRILALDYNDIRQRVREGSLRYVDQLNMASSDEREDV